MRTPVIIKPCIGLDGAGDKLYGVDINTFCMPDERTDFVFDKHGRQRVSKSTLYIDGEIIVTDDDTIIFDGKQYDIKRLSSTFDKGERSMWAVII
jgi:hypothetical protein